MSELALIKTYLLSAGDFELELASQNVTEVIRFHTDGVVEVLSPTYFHTPLCSDPKQRLFTILRQDSLITLQNGMVEDHVRRSIPIELSFGCVNLPCYGCLVNITEKGKGVYNTRVGSPYFFERSESTSDGPDYSRDLMFGMANLPQREAYVISVLSTGSYVFDGLDTLKLAPSSLPPIMILRRPPGGSSVSAFSGTFSMSTDVSMSINTDT